VSRCVARPCCWMRCWRLIYRFNRWGLLLAAPVRTPPSRHARAPAARSNDSGLDKKLQQLFRHAPREPAKEHFAASS